MSKKLQLTLALLKPDISLNEKSVSGIREMILKNNFLVVQSKFTKLTLEKAKEFYKVHESGLNFMYTSHLKMNSKFNHNNKSGPIWCHILARENAIAHWRKLMGPTKVFKTIYDDPTSIRGMYGTTDTRNATHGSDSDENAKLEIEFFFPEFNVNKWYEEEELYFRKNQVELDKVNFKHVIQSVSK